MQLQLIFFVLILHCMEYIECQHASRHRQHKQTPGVSSGCQGGCLTCSDSNGCLSCLPRLFIHLERSGMKQMGVCLTSCPNGFYGTRSPVINTCTKCRSECDSCFNKNFCTRCRAGYYLHRGKCQDNCPEGLARSDNQRECVSRCPVECDSCLNSDSCTRCKPSLYLLNGKCHHVCPKELEPDEQLMECVPQGHCEVGDWGEWSPCSRAGRTCGFKWGEETRTREVHKHPSPRGEPCPPTSEKRECFVKRKRCQGRRKGDRKGDRRVRNNRKEKEKQDGRRERRKEREREASDCEASENRNQTEHRRRRGQNRDPVSPEGGAAL